MRNNRLGFYIFTPLNEGNSPKTRTWEQTEVPYQETLYLIYNILRKQHKNIIINQHFY